tara:strand:+ start:15029 stop:15256 length:228 start_codon:yes stop_codon:yes gene_type:complete
MVKAKYKVYFSDKVGNKTKTLTISTHTTKELAGKKLIEARNRMPKNTPEKRKKSFIRMSKIKRRKPTKKGAFDWL